MKIKMEPEIISSENVKPSSPTPNHHKTHKLSLLDQIVPPMHVPLVLYFPNRADHNYISPDDFVSRTTQTLKDSLSKTLTRFYPLAGRVKDALSIDCNDEGVLFVVAKFTGIRLSDFLKKPDPLFCRAHVPSRLNWDEHKPGAYVTMIQINFFECGGIAIGSLFLHKVVDGATLGTFMKAWGTTARSHAEKVRENPNNNNNIMAFQSLFPHNKAMQRDSHLFSAMRQYFKLVKIVTRRYVFDGAAISAIRSKLGSSEGLESRPTRVETISAFMWKCFMIASKNSKNSRSLVTHSVNMRRKIEPPFFDNFFGNFTWLVPASSVNNNVELDHSDKLLKDLVIKMRNAISKVDDEFVGRMQGKEGFSGYCKNQQETWSEFPKDADYLSITSWCNFGLYGIDFGWGKPTWISKCDGGSDVELPTLNVLWLMDTRKGDGIEAWLTLDEKYVAAFDEIEELKDLAIVDPSPLEFNVRGDHR